MPKINILGDVFCDIIASGLGDSLPAWGEDKLAGISIFPGGSALNIAMHGATYAKFVESRVFEVALFSAIGNGDFYSKFVENELDALSPLLKNHVLKRSHQRTGTCIVLSGKKDRCFITDRGCMQEMNLSWFSWDLLLNADHIHIGGFYNCNGLHGENNNLKQLCQRAASMGISISLSPQFDASGTWGHITPLCPYLTFLIGNEYEINQIGNKGSLYHSTFHLLSLGCKNVVVTKGSEGACLFYLEPKDSNIVNNHSNIELDNIINETSHSISHPVRSHTNNRNVIQMNTDIDNNNNNNNICHNSDLNALDNITMSTAIYNLIELIQPIPCEVEVLDTTGAGDAFIGGFLVDWIEKKDYVSALAAGCFSGTAAVTVIGGSTCSTEILRQIQSLSLSSNNIYINKRRPSLESST